MSIPTMDGVTATAVSTPRLSTRVLFAGPEDGVPILFLHGNHSSATWWEQTMVSLPDGYRAIAPDQRGFGEADPSAEIDATRGMGDWGDDAVALMDHLGHDRFYLVGSSLGGNVAWWLIARHPGRLLGVAQVAPGSPWGFGGTKDAQGTPCFEDYAGSGAGLIAAPFVEQIRQGDMGTESPFSPRNVMRGRAWKEPPPREDDYIAALLQIHLGEHAYPGDAVPSPNWPYVAPGAWGPNNAISGKYPTRPEDILAAEPKPPILWLRGGADEAVSNAAAADLGTLGPTGIIPGYPGPEVYPPQPMLDQIEVVLNGYREAGGEVSEVVMPHSGHVPYIDDPEGFDRAFHAWLEETASKGGEK